MAAVDDAARATLAAGFRGEAAQTMLAIGGAESNWNEKAVGDGGNSFGWTQVHRPSHPQYSVATLHTYAGAAAAAWEISGHGTNFRPWTMFRNGRYRAYMGQAAAAIYTAGGPAGAVDPSGGVVGGAIDAIADPLRVIGRFVDALLNPRAWAVRLLEIVGGMLMVVAGALVVSKDLAPRVAGPLAKAVT